MNQTGSIYIDYFQNNTQIFQLNIFILKFFFVFVLALPQCFSIPVSFLSLTLASVRLFYSQRLGRFPDVDPSFKLISFVFPLIMLQISGSVASLVLSAAYLREVVIALIVFHILAQFIVLKFFLLKGNPILDNQTNIFWTAIFTSWMSPCTVWSNNLKTKSYFLLVSSCTSIIIHCFSLISICIYISLYDLSSKLAPKFHCHNASQDEIKNVFLTSQTFINICWSNDSCFPTQRVCSESENSTELFFTVILPIGLSLLFVSFLASYCLQFLGNYKTMYHWSMQFKCPILNFAMLDDLLRNHQKTEEFTAEMNEILDIAFEQDPTIFLQKDPMDGNTLLLAAVKGHLLDIVKKIGILVKNKL
jgi:hypothetical protein